MVALTVGTAVAQESPTLRYKGASWDGKHYANLYPFTLPTLVDLPHWYTALERAHLPPDQFVVFRHGEMRILEKSSNRALQAR